MATIAVVEDNETVRSTVRIILERLGHCVHVYEDGHDVLREPETRRPDVVLANILLPDSDAIQLIRNIVRARPDLPVIAMSDWLTGDNRESFLHWARMVGAHGAIPKPFSADQLASAIDQVL